MGFWDKLVGKSETIEKPTSVESKGEGVFKVHDVFNITGRGPIITGEVLSGSINLNSRTNISGKNVRIIKIEVNHKNAEVINKRDKAALVLEGIKKSDVKNGDELVLF
ncbi:hypothetical protein KO465_01825 [Candidatus Micrarchaeota archaeon]|jgi:selenocysteine-specific translation elongation factor|nr:hypothetical protein [Candidatus Micrarchaeota archaeon]